MNSVSLYINMEIVDSTWIHTKFSIYLPEHIGPGPVNVIPPVDYAGL